MRPFQHHATPHACVPFDFQMIGKTTTLSILSGEFPPTSGAAFIAGHDIATEQNKLRRKIGYCPQFSALLVRAPPTPP